MGDEGSALSLLRGDAESALGCLAGRPLFRQ
jgi:hypothetical protein